MNSATVKYTYFDGLNALRFFAAFTVLLSHIKANQMRMGISQLPDWPIFSKGPLAVTLFFVLSGFLITYRLLSEYESTGFVNIRQFYIRRIRRIWPLYYLVVIVGLCVYWYIFPVLGIEFPIEYNKTEAILLYTFFGANLISSLYRVGAIINLTWSIAIEEQFYLFWAPVLKYGRLQLPKIIAGAFLFFILLQFLNYYNMFSLSEGWVGFIETMQFHYLLVGSFFAWLNMYYSERLLNIWIFRTVLGQFLLFSLLLICVFIIPGELSNSPFLIIPNSLAFVGLIINVSINPKQLFALKSRFLNYFGAVSYGIYMYHMFAVYLTSFVVQRYFPDGQGLGFQLIFILAVFVPTLFISGISYRYMEKPIMEWKRDMQVKNPNNLTSPHDSAPD